MKMNRGTLYFFTFLIGLYALLPAAHWARPHLRDKPTPAPAPSRVEKCRRYGASWTPAASDRSLAPWLHCMGLDR